MTDNGEPLSYIGPSVYLGSGLTSLGMAFRNVCFMGNICCASFYLWNLNCWKLQLYLTSYSIDMIIK